MKNNSFRRTVRAIFFVMLVIVTSQRGMITAGIATFAVDADIAEVKSDRFIQINEQDLVTPDGEKFFLQGINLGNWLFPEGYYLLDRFDNYRKINELFCEMVGPDFTVWFWREYKKNYITRDDITFIKQTGMNSIRLPFHYKLFTEEDYMGLSAHQNGFEIFDQLLDWCRAEGLYVILNMHNAPGGASGDNVDDGYGYPWLYESEESQALYCDIWKRIATRYANDTIVLGYELLNEPLNPDYSHLNGLLEPFYKKGTAAIREVDKNHIILLGGVVWNKDFSVFSDWKFDDKIMYTCHQYWCDTVQRNIQHFLDFREKVNLPMYMGETGENTDEWIRAWTHLLERNNIGWHFWHYKKMAMITTVVGPRFPAHASMMSITVPENWNLLMEYVRADRSSFDKMRKARPDPALVRKAMTDLLENMKFKNCCKNEGYIQALGMKP